MGERVVTETAEEEEGGGARKGLGEVVVQLGSVEGERQLVMTPTQPRVLLVFKEAVRLFCCTGSKSSELWTSLLEPLID